MTEAEVIQQLREIKDRVERVLAKFEPKPEADAPANDCS